MDELLLLNLSQNCDVFSEFFECFDELSTAFGKGFPIDVRILSCELQDLIKVAGDFVDFRLSHLCNIMTNPPELFNQK